MCLFDLGTAVTKNLLRQDFKVTTILDINKDKCSNYPCKVVETPKQVAEEVDITITGTISIDFKSNDPILIGAVREKKNLF